MRRNNAPNLKTDGSSVTFESRMGMFVRCCMPSTTRVVSRADVSPFLAGWCTILHCASTSVGFTRSSFDFRVDSMCVNSKCITVGLTTITGRSSSARIGIYARRGGEGTERERKRERKEEEKEVSASRSDHIPEAHERRHRQTTRGREDTHILLDTIGKSNVHLPLRLLLLQFHATRPHRALLLRLELHHRHDARLRWELEERDARLPRAPARPPTTAARARSPRSRCCEGRGSDSTTAEDGRSRRSRGVRVNLRSSRSEELRLRRRGHCLDKRILRPLHCDRKLNHRRRVVRQRHAAVVRSV